MGLFNKSDPQQEIVASNALKILNESVNIFNNTKNPDTFFERYSWAERQADILCQCKKVKFKGQQPAQIKKMLENKKQFAIHDMIDRFFDDTELKASKVKRLDLKKSKFINFVTVLEDYYSLMNQENIDYVNTLYKNALNYLS